MVVPVAPPGPQSDETTAAELALRMASARLHIPSSSTLLSSVSTMIVTAWLDVAAPSRVAAEKMMIGIVFMGSSLQKEPPENARACSRPATALGRRRGISSFCTDQFAASGSAAFKPVAEQHVQIFSQPAPEPAGQRPGAANCRVGLGGVRLADGAGQFPDAAGSSQPTARIDAVPGDIPLGAGPGLEGADQQCTANQSLHHRLPASWLPSVKRASSTARRSIVSRRWFSSSMRNAAISASRFSRAALNSSWLRGLASQRVSRDRRIWSPTGGLKNMSTWQTALFPSRGALVNVK